MGTLGHPDHPLCTARDRSKSAPAAAPNGGYSRDSQWSAELATLGRAGIPSLQEVLTRVMRTRTGRVGVLVAWAWVGLHFFAR